MAPTSSRFLRLAKLQSILALKAERQVVALREERDRIDRLRTAIETFRTQPESLGRLAVLDASLVAKRSHVAASCASAMDAARMALAKRDKWRFAAADALRDETRQAQDRELEEVLEQFIQRAQRSNKDGPV